MPRGRSDLAVGGAYRVPFGDLAPLPSDPASQVVQTSAAGGGSPVAFMRHGLDRDVDLGVEATASQLTVQLRGQHELGGFLRLVYGLAPFVGLAENDGIAVRGGGTVPLVLAIDVFSLFEAWIGLRASVEHGAGDLGDPATPLSFTAVRTGGVVGLAAGFRRVHVLIELGIDHEAVFGSVGDISIERNGLVLTPAFALRLRL